VKKYAILSVES